VATKTEISNMALSQIGANLVNNVVTDQTREAQVARLHFDTVRDEVLADFPWRFADKQVDLGAPLTEIPEYDFDNAFQLPPDHISTLQTDLPSNARWQVVGDRLFTDNSGVNILYTRRVEDTSKWPPLFVSCVMYLLASRIATSVGNRRPETVTGMYQLYQLTLARAGTRDGQQADPQTITDQTLIDVRIEGAAAL
jgi:hypothetical protein